MIEGVRGSEAARLSASGKLWKDALIMRDDVSHSLWSQLEGRAVAGPQEGEQLAVYPHFERTSYAAWKARHPATLVLRKEIETGRGVRSAYAQYFANPRALGVLGSENPDDRLPGKELVVGVAGRDEQVAIVYATLERVGALSFLLDGIPSTCRIDTMTADVRCEVRSDGKTEPTSNLQATLVFWFAWAQAYPETQVID